MCTDIYTASYITMLLHNITYLFLYLQSIIQRSSSKTIIITTTTDTDIITAIIPCEIAELLLSFTIIIVNKQAHSITCT